MKLKDFNKLDYDAKLYKVVDEGTFLENYITKDIRMNLYAVGMFYVELVYDGDENKIMEVRSFKYGHSLGKYTPKL